MNQEAERQFANLREIHGACCAGALKHAWAGAWVCSAFRNESPHLSSSLIREAVAATRSVWEPPPLGIVTFVNAAKVRHKRDPGRCFLRAGFVPVGTTKGGLLAFRLAPDAMPNSDAPLGTQASLYDSAQAALPLPK